MLQYSDDNSSWTDAGSFDDAPLISQTFSPPITARYLRLVATAPNPNGEWVEVREFQVWGPASELTSTMESVPGHGPERAFDASVATTFAGSRRPGLKSELTRTLAASRHVGSIAIVGRATGELQVRTKSGWHHVGNLDSNKSFQQLAVSESKISAARIVFAEGSSVPIVNEFDLRKEGAPVPVAPGLNTMGVLAAIGLALTVIAGALIGTRTAWSRPRRLTSSKVAAKQAE
jgi:hyaluronoglucosaminidase